jgi:hypothetical protein
LVWIARLDAPSVAAWAREDDLTATVEQDRLPPTVARGYIATLAAGAIVVVVVSMRLSPPAGAELELTNLADWTDAVIPIWPIGVEVAWPPAQTLTLESLLEFARTWVGGT